MPLVDFTSVPTEQNARIDVERDGDLLDGRESGDLLIAEQFADVATAQPREVREPIHAPPIRFAQCAHARCEASGER